MTIKPTENQLLPYHVYYIYVCTCHIYGYLALLWNWDIQFFLLVSIRDLNNGLKLWNTRNNRNGTLLPKHYHHYSQKPFLIIFSWSSPSPLFKILYCQNSSNCLVLSPVVLNSFKLQFTWPHHPCYLVFFFFFFPDQLIAWMYERSRMSHEQIIRGSINSGYFFQFD